MKTATTIAAIGLLALGLSGCSYYARGADDYRKVTRELLSENRKPIRACYKRELGENEKANGKVTIAFEVEAKTGVIEDVKVIEQQTTANKQLQKCVVDTVTGLKLDPPDEREGRGTFTYAFTRD